MDTIARDNASNVAISNSLDVIGNLGADILACNTIACPVINYLKTTSTPFFIQGYVNAVTPSFTDLGGAYIPTVTKTSDYSQSVLDIAFPSAHPRGTSYCIHTTANFSGFVKVTESIAVTSTKFTTVSSTIASGSITGRRAT